MSESVTDNSFQSRLSSFLTKTLNDANQAPNELVDLANFVTYSSTVPGTDPSVSVTSPIIQTQSGANILTAATANASLLADSLTLQKSANERLRLAVLLPAQQQLQSYADDEDKKRPSMAELARCQRLKRVLDVHSDTMKIEQEIYKVWAGETVINQLKQFTRCSAMEIIERSTQTLVERSKFSPRRDASESVTRSNQSLGRSTELTVYYCHEAVEKILYALLELGSTMQVTGGKNQDDVVMMMEFDAISRRQNSPGSPTNPMGKNTPKLVNYTTAIDSLLASLPPKYKLDALKSIDSQFLS